MKDLCKMKFGKGAGVDGIAVKLIKKGSDGAV